MNADDEQRLQAVFRREGRSLLRYVAEAAPYAAGADRKVLAAVNRMAAEHATALRGYEAYLTAARVPPPYPGAFPVGFTDLNFTAVRHLLPKLVADRRQAAADLAADAASLTDPGSAAVRSLADLARNHLAELQSLNTSNDPTP